MQQARQQFGGDWTAEKLERVRKYLVAYATIMKDYRFRYAYIDAFAGTGYRTLRKDDDTNELMFPEFAESSSVQFLDGSARIALQVRPKFESYIFIEQDRTRFQALEQLRVDFPEVQTRIKLVNADANTYLQNLCFNKVWKDHRAVLFLDPFGMQVQWRTIEAIAQTKAIDLWILFPLGVAINRLLRRDGNINETWRNRLDTMFGTTDWFEAFYQPKVQPTLFGDEVTLEKTGDFSAIAQYFVKRLKTVFAGVAGNPLPLYNSRNNPLYLLCFASGNPKGSKTAIKIANDILKR